MTKYIVYGTSIVEVAVRVEAGSPDDAIDLAAESFGGIRNYCGNNGCHKLVGVSGSNESLEPIDDVDFHSAESEE